MKAVLTFTHLPEAVDGVVGQTRQQTTQRRIDSSDSCLLGVVLLQLCQNGVVTKHPPPERRWVTFRLKVGVAAQAA